MQEITKSNNERPKTEKMIWLFFALVIVIVYFFGLTMPLVGPDEPRYAQVAREMFERGDFVTPTLGGANWFEKPALLYWLQIVSYKLFGVSEFAARFGSAIFGLGTILSLWILGRQTVTETELPTYLSAEQAKIQDPKPKTDFANWLALVAASSIGLIVFSRGASFDIILTFPLTAALVAFFVYDQSQKKSAFTSYPLLSTFYFFIGVALLAKGLIGIVFPFVIIAFYFLLSRKLPNKTFIYSLFWGTTLSLLVASTWYLPMSLRHGWTFINEFFVQHHFQRFTSDKYQHHQPFWFFWLVLPLMTLPWLPFFLISIWDFFKVQSSKFKVLSQELSSYPRAFASPLSVFAFAWLIIPLVFFTFSGSKLPGYILPALPAALVLTTESIFRFVRKSEKRKLVLQITAFAFFAVIAILLQFVVPKYADADSVKNLIETTNAKGYTTQKIVNLYTVSHNAEFYAPERLVRDSDGKLKRYDNFSELIKDLERGGEREVLVLVSHTGLKEVAENDWVGVEILADNGETAIIFVKVKF